METIDRTCTRTENGKKVEYPAPFTSAMVQTKDDNGVKYSIKGDFYAEARIKLPENAPSSWSSLWTTGEKGGPWPGNGEIDVFESKGWDASYLQANTHTPRQGNPSKSEQHHGQLANDGTTQSQFHTYGVEKTGDKITFYLDGVPSHVVNYADIKGTNPFLDEDYPPPQPDGWRHLPSLGLRRHHVRGRYPLQGCLHGRGSQHGRGLRARLQEGRERRSRGSGCTRARADYSG